MNIDYHDPLDITVLVQLEYAMTKALVARTVSISDEISNIETQLRSVQHLLDNDDGWRWPRAAPEEDPVDLPADGRDLMAIKSVVFDKLFTRPLLLPGSCPDKCPDRLAQKAAKQTGKWVKMNPRDKKLAMFYFNPYPCDTAKNLDERLVHHSFKECKEAYGMGIEYERRGHDWWYRWSGDLTTRLDNRLISFNIREAERQLLQCRIPFYQATDRLFRDSEVVCRIQRMADLGYRASCQNRTGHDARCLSFSEWLCQHYQTSIEYPFGRLCSQKILFDNLIERLRLLIHATNGELSTPYLVLLACPIEICILNSPENVLVLLERTLGVMSRAQRPSLGLFR